MSEQLTQEELTQLLEAEKAKYQELESQLIALQQVAEQKELEATELNNKLFNQKVESKLREHGLENFLSVISVSSDEELEEAITKLTQAVSNSNMDFVPSTKKKHTSAYDIAASKGDTVGMIGSKLSKLFK